MGRPAKYTKEEAGERRRAASLAAHKRATDAARDIGTIPEIVDPERRDECKPSLRRFCECYHSDIFCMAWSKDHLRVIEKAERAIMTGGLFALAMPRGSGKTSLAECACLWAMLFGHRRFVCLVGSDATASEEMLDSIKTQIEVNELLFEDFPEVCFPVRKLNGIAHRAAGQTHKGERTAIEWTTTEIALPVIDGSLSSNCLVQCRGITGRIRGMKKTIRDGSSVRPDLVIVDDPQTDESATSAAQCAKRESIVSGAILGLAGPGKSIAGIMPCTVISPGDMADNILDKDKHPDWNGERTKLVYKFPDDTELWEKYANIRKESLKSTGTIEKATQFYKDNRKAMDAGSEVAWPERYLPTEISAIQHAMNLKIKNEDKFFAEYQNDPRDMAHDDLRIGSDDIMKKINRLDRFLVPSEARCVTAMVDIQGKCLYYTVIAWADQFTGWVVDYGTWPEQGARYFTLTEVKKTMARALPGHGFEAQLYNALEKLSMSLFGRGWIKDDGTEMALSRMLIDANWQESTAVVHQFCRQSEYRDRVMPSYGRFIGAGSTPMNDVNKKQGEIVGHNWRMPPLIKGRSVRHLLYDTNYWKTFIYGRLSVAMGDPGCLSLFGRSTTAHRMYADQLTAEYHIKNESRGRVVDEWKQRPDRADNHWFDCTVGCAVAASMAGVRMVEWEDHGKKRKKRRSRKRGVYKR